MQFLCLLHGLCVPIKYGCFVITISCHVHVHVYFNLVTVIKKEGQLSDRFAYVDFCYSSCDF